MDGGVGITLQDAYTRDMYTFFDANEAMDVANDRGNLDLRPPLSAEHKTAMASNKPSIVKVPMHMADFIKGFGGGS